MAMLVVMLIMVIVMMVMTVVMVMMVIRAMVMMVMAMKACVIPSHPWLSAQTSQATTMMILVRMAMVLILILNMWSLLHNRIDFISSIVQALSWRTTRTSRTCTLQWPTRGEKSLSSTSMGFTGNAWGTSLPQKSTYLRKFSVRGWPQIWNFVL